MNEPPCRTSKRSTRAMSACTTCSIQMMEMPPCRMRRIKSTRTVHSCSVMPPATSSSRRNRAAGDAEQRGLAGAIWPDNTESLAFGEQEVDPVCHDYSAEAFGDFFEGEDGRHAVVRSRRGSLYHKHPAPIPASGYGLSAARSRTSATPEAAIWRWPPFFRPDARKRLGQELQLAS